MTTSSTMSSRDLDNSLELFEVKPGKRFSVSTLRSLLPDTESVLFFGKLYNLDASQLAALLLKVLNTDLALALFGEGQQHSVVLQGYLCEGYTEHEWDCPAADWDGRECTCVPIWHDPVVSTMAEGDVVFDPDVPKGEILPQVWESLEVEVASSIQAVADKLESVVTMLPGKQGSMMFGAMMKMNAKRPIVGDYRASIHHERQKQNLLILDVSGSMNSSTIGRIINDVVALSYTANADMAIVSNSTHYWEAGSYDVDEVLSKAEYGGTYYETLHELLQRDWGTVITVADYDSSESAKRELKRKCQGHIDLVLDVSLVNRPTFLAECVGQFADEVRPILIASTYNVLA